MLTWFVVFVFSRDEVCEAEVVVTSVSELTRQKTGVVGVLPLSAKEQRAGIADCFPNG